MSRFKIFESSDTDESVDALNRFFGERNSVNRLSDEANLTSIAAGSVASSLLVHFRSTHELFIERKDTTDHVFVNIAPIDGLMHVAGNRKGEVTAAATLGVIVSMDKSTKVVVSGYNGRGLLIPRSTIHDELESLIGKRPVVPVEFEMGLDSASGGGSLIHNAIETAARQLAQAQSPLGYPAVAARLEEFIINALLHGQPHNYRDALTGERRTAAAPKQVRRAEDYIQAHMGEVIKLSQIAEAAGCSIRALQLAFRTFRDTTPMALLRQARLERAHEELSQSDSGATTVTEIAIKYGFFNIGRFAQDYRSAIGELPSETLRRQPARPHMK